jgi:hypothetical protein
MDNPVVLVVSAILGSNALTVFVQYLLTHRGKSRGDQKLIRDTLAAVTYSLLSREVECMLTRGYATPEERRSIKIMYDAYKANGWNGDMEARMTKVYALPTANLSEVSK